jgi:predicted acylesterase/phospholipase RssA
MVPPVSRVGLVLGGGGITGAAFEMATLMAIELATG